MMMMMMKSGCGRWQNKESLGCIEKKNGFNCISVSVQSERQANVIYRISIVDREPTL